MATQPLWIGYNGEAQPVEDQINGQAPLQAKAQQIVKQTTATAGPKFAVALFRSPIPQSPQAAMIEQQAGPRSAQLEAASAVVARIDDLAVAEDEVKPSEYAYARARSIVESAYGQIRAPRNVPEVVPEALATTDEMGGIRLAWRLGTRQIRANFGGSPERRSYIYFESSAQHGIDELDATHLSGRLAWLTER
jgi:hypothetical protein